MKQVYKRLGLRLTQRKLGQAVPVIGIAIGAGVNARMLSTIVDDAHHSYRERFLRDKYGIEALATDGAAGTPDEEVIDVAKILDVEIVEERGDLSQNAP